MNATVDLVSLGETMATFVPLDAVDRFRLVTAGGESNVAAGMAVLGCRTQWWSRLGTDRLGDIVAAAVAAHGVDVVVDRDPARPTGAAVKEIGPDGSRMRYYRKGSAASRLDLLDVSELQGVRRLHVTGVTPALSPQDRAVVEQLFAARTGGTSFDLNYRPVLWQSVEQAGEVLVPLARRADVVFVGDDEARALLGTDDVDQIADRLLVRPGQQLVLKRGASLASLVTTEARARGRRVDEPALHVAVVDVIGAGDAFAAGFLAATVWGWSARGRLRLGHWLAAQVVGVPADTVASVDRDDLLAIATELGHPVPGTERTTRDEPAP